jgi:alkaline phosphatase D
MRHLTHGPHIGRLTSTSARVWLRLDGDGHARLRFAPAAHPELAMAVALDSERARVSPAQQAHAEQDHIVTCDLTGLEPDTTYTFQVEVSEDGERFTPRNVLGTEHGRFATFPADDRLSRELVFAFGSCFHPYVCSDRIFESLAELCDRESGMRFALWLGDQIYADLMPKELTKAEPGGADPGSWNTPFSLGFGDSDYREALDFTAYKRVYRAFWRSLAMRRANMRLPSFRIFDDHEIADDWGIDGENATPERVEQRAAALRAYELYQHCTNPPTPAGRYWYTFRVADVGFFVLDTRTGRHWLGPDKMLLDQEQMAALKEWLTDDSLAVKFIASSVPIVHISSIFRLSLPDFIPSTRDQWTGFDEQRQELLGFIFERNIRNVHFLSGDVHIAHVARIGNGTEGNHVMSFTSSPLAQESPVLQEYVALKDHLDGYQVEPIFTGAGRNFGLIRVTPPAADDARRDYRVSCELYDRDAERFFSYPGRAMIVLDIDRTLSTDDVLERESTPYLNAARVVRRLHERFGVVYLTARPRFLPYVGMARDWLRNHGFPVSQIVMLMKPWDVLPWRHGIYKDEMIRHMVQHQRHTPVIGIGDRKTDAQAYLENGITPLIIADDDEEIPAGARLIHPNAERSIWEQIEEAIFDEITEAEILRRRDELYGR